MEPETGVRQDPNYHRILHPYLQNLKDEALERVATAEKWCLSYTLVPETGERCLKGHAQNYHLDYCGYEVMIPTVAILVQEPTCWVDTFSVGCTFDRLGGRYGLDPLVQAIREDARKILEERKCPS